MIASGRSDAAIESIHVSTYRIPTDAPEADGTYAWNSTTLVVVQIRAGDETGLGYTYADLATAILIERKLAKVVEGADGTDIPGCWTRMVQAIRNLGRPGIASMAISAVDFALWDLKARLLQVSLAALLGCARHSAPVYGSGGFTSYSLPQLQTQLADWVAAGIGQVKMKIGSNPEQDVTRVRSAREAIGDQTRLMVDANGAYQPKFAIQQAAAFADLGVCWFEEPVSSDNLAGLRFVREHCPPAIEVAAGEYGYDNGYFRRMLEAGAVDVLQADGTRCGGITGFLQAGAIADAFQVDLSSHCAPAIHLAACCAVPRLRHMEFFHDHVRIERMLFEGFPEMQAGRLVPDCGRPGHGLALRTQAAERFSVHA
jgi:L-alanine-DL-glutamate epimerase-like enolase superfamily enzyme